MSEGFRHFYYTNGFHQDNDQKSSNTTNFTLEQYSYNTDTTPSTFSAHHHPRQMFEYPSHISSSFDNELVLQDSNDQNSFSGVYGLMVPSSSELLFKEEQQLVSEAVQVTNEVPNTPNSSISSDSAEAATGDDHIQDSNKGKKESGADDDSVMKETLEGNEDPLKKEVKGKKKAEKKQRPPRFAFMTKSDVDHLEDGYRWRKYGQKAVKNSRYPRSYYRCTTQKCPVKKRIERSFQDPLIVITTYEGQHNHHVPVNLRGNVAVGMFPPPMFGHHQLPLALDQVNPSFHQEVMLGQMPHYFYGSYGGVGSSNIHVYDRLHQEQELQSLNVNPQQRQQQFQQFSDYGLLQDMMNNPVFPKQEE